MSYCYRHKESFGVSHTICASCKIEDMQHKVDDAEDYAEAVVVQSNEAHFDEVNDLEHDKSNLEEDLEDARDEVKRLEGAAEDFLSTVAALNLANAMGATLEKQVKQLTESNQALERNNCSLWTDFEAQADRAATLEAQLAVALDRIAQGWELVRTGINSGLDAEILEDASDLLAGALTQKGGEG